MAPSICRWCSCPGQVSELHAFNSFSLIDTTLLMQKAYLMLSISKSKLTFSPPESVFFKSFLYHGMASQSILLDHCTVYGLFLQLCLFIWFHILVMTTMTFIDDCNYTLSLWFIVLTFSKSINVSSPNCLVVSPFILKKTTFSCHSHNENKCTTVTIPEK